MSDSEKEKMVEKASEMKKKVTEDMMAGYSRFSMLDRFRYYVTSNIVLIFLVSLVAFIVFFFGYTGNNEGQRPPDSPRMPSTEHIRQVCPPEKACPQIPPRERVICEPCLDCEPCPACPKAVIVKSKCPKSYAKSYKSLKRKYDALISKQKGLVPNRYKSANE